MVFFLLYLFVIFVFYVRITFWRLRFAFTQIFFSVAFRRLIVAVCALPLAVTVQLRLWAAHLCVKLLLISSGRAIEAQIDKCAPAGGQRNI